MKRRRQQEGQQQNNGPTTATTKKTTITFAIDDDVLNEIRRDAEHQGLSINSKINSILRKYAYFYRYAEKENPVVIPSRRFQFVIDSIEENKLLDEYKTLILDTIPSDLIQKKVLLTLENWIKYVFEGECLLGGSYQDFSYYRDEEGCLCLLFRHIYGIKWSRIISSAFCYHLENMLGYHTQSTILASSIVIKILERNIPDIK